jgi:hypothetical protein
MKQDRGAYKKAAVLTGATLLAGGAEISGAVAATCTITPPPAGATCTAAETHPFGVAGVSFPSETLSFNQFDPTLGTLTSVDFGLNSAVNNAGTLSGTISAVTSSPPNQTLFTIPTGASGTLNATFSGLQGTIANGNFYKGTSTISILVQLGSGVASSESWNGFQGFTGLTLQYDYMPTSSVPVPAALPLFATGLAGIGVTAWRSRRKRKATQQA